MRYIHVVILASPRNVENDFQSWRTISWKRSFRTSWSCSYIIQTLYMRPWCSLINLMNRCSSLTAKGFFLIDMSKIGKENYTYWMNKRSAYYDFLADAFSKSNNS